MGALLRRLLRGLGSVLLVAAGLAAAYAALLVPDAAIVTEQARKYLLVLGADNVATQKYVTLGQVVDGLRVIKEGLAGDDRVIINGLLQARPGSKVTPQEGQIQPAQKSASSGKTD